jgi:hypothetical protein
MKHALDHQKIERSSTANAAHDWQGHDKEDYTMSG